MKVYVLKSIDDDKYEEVLADTLFNIPFTFISCDDPAHDIKYIDL